jgi:S1-C subfamily serine protease
VTRTRATIRIWIGAPIAIAALAALIAIDWGSGRGGGPRPVGPDITGTHTVKFARVLEIVRPHIVEVRALQRQGPGIVFDSNGDIVTNAHVLGSAKRATVTLFDGTQQQADAIGVSPQHDLAVVRLAGQAPQPAAFADSSKVEVGDSALAIGNQLASAWSITRVIGIPTGGAASPDNGETLNSVILTSDPISTGDSGGVLVDLAGRVIGISALAAINPELENAIANGIGFAIPSDTVLRVAGQLITSAMGGSRRPRPPS